MTKKEPLPVLNATPEGFPIAISVSAALNGKFETIGLVDTDLLVLSRLEHTILGGGPSRFDAALGGCISRKLSESRFQGNRGDSLLFSTGHERIRNVLIVGIGAACQVGRRTICGLFEHIIEKAEEIGANKVSLPIFPGRLTAPNLKGTLAVLRCRMAQHYSIHAGRPRIKEFEILCTPQAKRHIVNGLAVHHPLCPTCPAPKITDSD